MDCLMIKQKTLKKPIATSGVGVHSGNNVCLTLRPAPVNTGIIFRRVDLEVPIEIPAQVSSVSDTMLSTSLASNGARIATVEHLLSVLAGLGIDNLYVDVDGPELPIKDGSGAPFVALIEYAGVERQTAPKQFIRITDGIEVRDQDKWARLEPFSGFKVTFHIEYDHPVIKATEQMLTVDFAHTSYAEEIAAARTFGFLSEYEYIRKNNLARGASLDNAIVLDESQVLNNDGLRCSDEFVKHKILDAIGDLYLLGHNVLGAFTGYKSGHALNNALLRQVLTNRQAWEIVTCESPTQSTTS